LHFYKSQYHHDLISEGTDYFLLTFLAVSFLILEICCFSQRWPAANIILTFCPPILSSACSLFSAIFRLSFKTSISAFAASLTSFNSSLAATLAFLSVILVAVKSSRNFLSNACHVSQQLSSLYWLAFWQKLFCLIPPYFLERPFSLLC